MGSIAQESNQQTGEENAVTILVTGFGPFQERFPINPSFEITKSLPEYLPVSRRHSTAVRIISFGSAIRVAYDEVRELVPKMHKAYEGTVDLVLHIGMASGRNYYCIERYGRRDGYTKNKDLDGKMPRSDEGIAAFPDCPPTMTTSLKYDNVLQSWQDNALAIPKGHPGFEADIRMSEDAGRYLCDYIYFNSLAYFGRHSGKMTQGEDSDRPVLFFHVPAESDAKMLEQGHAVAIALIRAMADNFTKQREDGGVPVV